MHGGPATETEPQELDPCATAVRRARRRRRRLLVLIVVVVLGALAAVGIAWWTDRGPSRPSIGGAVDRFRSSSTSRPVTSALQPAAGVYIYSGTGEERLSFLSTHQSQDGNLPGTVTMGAVGCWTFAIQYNSFHRQTWTRCPVGGQLVERGGTTDQKFDFGVLSQSEHSVVTCDPPTTVFDPTAAPGDRVPVRCSGRSLTTKADMTQRGSITFVGRTSVLVNGTRVAALHYTQDFTITGDQTGSQHEDLWIAAANALPLREERRITVVSPAPAPLGRVTYTERGGWRLTSLTPRT
jgi:hypothetical protein